MRTYLIGVNGEQTPDPNYWRTRNELIPAPTADDAISKWLGKRGGWYAGEPISIIDVTDQQPDEMEFGSEWCFTANGASRIREVQKNA